MQFIICFSEVCCVIQKQWIQTVQKVNTFVARVRKLFVSSHILSVNIKIQSIMIFPENQQHFKVLMLLRCFLNWKRNWFSSQLSARSASLFPEMAGFMCILPIVNNCFCFLAHKLDYAGQPTLKHLYRFAWKPLPTDSCSHFQKVHVVKRSETCFICYIHTSVWISFWSLVFSVFMQI